MSTLGSTGGNAQGSGSSGGTGSGTWHPVGSERALSDRSLTARLAGLRALAAQRPVTRLGTNSHVHTNHSFSVFRSPSEAAWVGAKAGLEVLGINDFFTVSGHAEFAEACAILGLPALFCLECIAIDPEAAAAGVRLNDPGNPGRVYLCGKGVTRPDAPAAAALLARIRANQDARNRQLIANLDHHFRSLVHESGPSYDDCLNQTPHGLTTERHVARAVLQRIATIVGSSSVLRGEEAFAELFTRIVGVPPKGNEADWQVQIRSQLLKTGKPGYAPEDPAAFPGIPELRRCFLDLGAIPTYPVLGDPVTEGERDIRILCDRIAAWGFHALELIPARNSEARVAAVLAEAARRGWPVCDGTEHNTAAMEPMTTTWGLDERFRGAFRDGACLVLGHQLRVRAGQPGYVDAHGDPVSGGAAACIAAGRAAL